MPKRSVKSLVLGRVWEPGPDFWILVTGLLLELSLIASFLTGKWGYAERILIPLFAIWLPLAVNHGLQRRRQRRACLAR